MKKKNTTLLIALGCITLAAQGQTVQGRHHPVSAEASPYAAFGDTTRTLDCRHADYARYEVPVILDDETSATLVFDFPRGKAVLKDEAGCVLSTDSLPEHLQAIFLSADPKATDYPHVSAYAYCMGSPVNVIDPDGQKIVFINGLDEFGAPPAGVAYWNGANSSFVRGAKKFFLDPHVYFVEAKHNVFSSANGRMKNGYNWAKENIEILTKGMSNGEAFELVSHSMGGAFAKGVENYLKDNGYKVKSSVFINTYQVDNIVNPVDNRTTYIDYQNTNDPVLFWFDLNKGHGKLMNATKNIREKSNNSFWNIHRDPIGQGELFWKKLKVKMMED